MPVSDVTVNGHIAADYMKVTPNVMGSMWAIWIIAKQNDAYIITLRDAMIAAGRNPESALVTRLTDAHYLCSDAMERCGTMDWVALMQKAALDVEAGVSWLEEQPETPPP